LHLGFDALLTPCIFISSHVAMQRFLVRAETEPTIQTKTSTGPEDVEARCTSPRPSGLGKLPSRTLRDHPQVVPYTSVDI
jgi:hypothetical protein